MEVILIGNLLVLIGMGLFLRIFFDLIKKADENNKSKRNMLLLAHCLLGISFIVVGRILVR